MNEDLNEILHDVSKSNLIDDGDLQAAGLLILTAAIQGLDIQRAGIWLLTEDKSAIRGRMLIDGNHCEIDSAIALARSDFPVYFSALDSERAIVAHNAHTHESTAEFSSVYLTPFKISSMLDAPIRHRGKFLGIICCEHQGEARTWNSAEVAFATALAEAYGRAISAEQRNHYAQQLKQNNEQLEQKILERTQTLESALRNLTHTQAQLIESEKLASIGRLVAGLAHEINTPLGIAVTSSSHCQSELSTVQKLYKDELLDEGEFANFLTNLDEGLGLINTNLNRAASLIQNFKLSGAIHSANEQERFELRDCIALTLKSLQPLLNKNAITCTLQEGDAIKINSHPGAIAQIITNLITNSIHHAFADVDNKQIALNISQKDDLAVIHYSDNGCGIHADIRTKIFEPFFTTARKTGGSGLGLSIVHNLATQKLHGSIDIDTDQTHGARFTITLPCNL